MWVLASVMFGSSDTNKMKSTYPLITVHYEEQDLGIALKDIAKQMRVNVVIGPQIAGQATLRAKHERWEDVLAQLLGQSGFQYKIVETGPNSPVLVVAESVTRLDEICENLRTTRGCTFPAGVDGKVRAEFLFEFASADSWMDFLKNEYNRVRFEPHPVLNGFFATGSREDLDLIRKDVANIDKQENSGPSPTQLRP